MKISERNEWWLVSGGASQRAVALPGHHSKKFDSIEEEHLKST
jgi:hypothetical protein